MIMPPRNAPQAVTCPHRVASRQHDTTAGMTAATISCPPDPAPDDGASSRNVGRRPMNAAHLRRRLTYCVDRLALGAAGSAPSRGRFSEFDFCRCPRRRRGGDLLQFGFVLGTLFRGTLGLGGLALLFDTIGLGFKTCTFLAHLLGEPRTVFGLSGRLWRGRRRRLCLGFLGGFLSGFCGAYVRLPRQPFVRPFGRFAGFVKALGFRCLPLACFALSASAALRSSSARLAAAARASCFFTSSSFRAISSSFTPPGGAVDSRRMIVVWNSRLARANQS